MSALGPRFGEEGCSSEVVDYKGVQSAIEAAEAFLTHGDDSKTSPGTERQKYIVVPGGDGSGEGGPGGMWEPLDDVIMGGRSSSAWQAGVGSGALERQSGKMFGRWAGTLVTEGGGFCGTVVKVCYDIFITIYVYITYCCNMLSYCFRIISGGGK